MRLDQLRNRIEAIDRQIIDLIAERQALSDQIGVVKRSEGRATRDFSREKQVIEAARGRAVERGVSPAVAESLMELLIRSSLTTQERARVRAEGAGRGQPALVIGGSGKMGRWFVEFLDSQGFDVSVADPAGPVPGFRSVADWRVLTEDFAMTVVATPLRLTADVLQEMAERGHRGLIFDIGSVKAPLVAGLQALAARGARVVSLHPMFGPDTQLLSGRHVLFMDVGVPEAVREARQLFASTMVQQMEMPLADHDRLIAFVLGLSHAVNIAFFTVLAESGESAPRLANLSSTTFDAQLEVASRVARENPHLYFEIQSLNPDGLDALGDLLRTVRRLTEIVGGGDAEAFVALMEQGRRYLAQRA
ncbi:MAG: prephenate dehydrogenase/arogenate dehydrogenase family protein [Gammaproteobacteria bacterium]|nr:MAG: prephenate dehydrogenase/arogenate dehydrogenase family protein [Gammaproteobacteria bacterium]